MRPPQKADGYRPETSFLVEIVNMYAENQASRRELGEFCLIKREDPNTWGICSAHTDHIHCVSSSLKKWT